MDGKNNKEEPAETKFWGLERLVLMADLYLHRQVTTNFPTWNVRVEIQTGGLKGWKQELYH